MLKGVLSFIRPPKSLLIFLPNFLHIKMVIFAQVIMLCSSPYFIFLLAENVENIGFIGTFNIYKKEVQEWEGGGQPTPFFILS